MSPPAAASETAKPTTTAKTSKTAAKGSATDNGSTITSAPASSSGAVKTKGSSETKATSGASKTNGDASKTTKKSSKTPAVDPRLPAGGVQMLTPATTAATTYYKVGDYVTFGWNYTSLSVTPSHIDVYVTCTANSATYTVANNASYDPKGHAVWNTSADATGKAPLLTDQYTLVIHDAAKDVTAVASAGYLGAYDQFTFGMYTPQPYVPKDSQYTLQQPERSNTDSVKQNGNVQSAVVPFQTLIDKPLSSCLACASSRSFRLHGLLAAPASYEECKGPDKVVPYRFCAYFLGIVECIFAG